MTLRTAGSRTNGLGNPLPDEILRERLISRLADRWTRRLMTIKAPGGYGKSVALAQAIRDNETDPTGIDLYVRCRRSGEGLAGLESAFGRLTGTATSSQAAGHVAGEAAGQTARGSDLAAHIIEVVSSMSPQQVCLCLDDVHVLHDSAEFADLIEALIQDLPFNGHLVLSGRSMPPMRTAKLRASDDLGEIEQSDLTFDRGEVGVLAAHHGVPPERLATAAGWPAVSRLLVVADRDVSVEFMIEEVIGRLTTSEQQAIALAIIAAPATRELLENVVPDIDVGALLEAVPLMSDDADGNLVAHDLWHGVLDSIIGADEQVELAEQVIGFHEHRGEYGRAIETALDRGVWRSALAPMMAALGVLDINVELSQMDRWLQALPSAAHETPEWAFLAGLRARLSGDSEDSTALIRRAAADFEAAGNLDCATTAVLELGLRSWMGSDEALWTEVVEAGGRIIAAGGERMARVAQMAGAVEAERVGDFAGALAVYESIADRSAIESGHAWMLAMLLGDLDGALGYLEEVIDQSPRLAAASQLLLTHWEAGDPQPLLTAGPDAIARLSVVSQRDAARRLTAEIMIGANRGVRADVGQIEFDGLDRSRQQALVALGQAATMLFTESEETVGARFEACLDEVGMDDPLLRGELRRYLPYPYILSPRCREWIDAHESLGPLQIELRALARAVLRGREGHTIGALPPAPSILTWLPLPWSVELAVRLVGAGDPRGTELIEVLSDVTGAAARDEVRRLRDGDNDGGSREALPAGEGGRSDRGVSAAANRVLAEIPSPPTRVAHLVVANGFHLRHGTEEFDGGRSRVEQLLTLLTLRDDWTRRQLAEVMWPGDESRARTNLRVTLSHARRAIDPDRAAGEAGFSLRQRGDRVWLQRSKYLTVDLWAIESLLNDADAAERRSDSERALRDRLDALHLWGSDALSVLVGLEMVEPDVEAWRRRIVSAGSWAAERLLAAGDVADARQAADRLIDVEPFAERAHDVTIGACLAAGDLHAAGAAIDSLRHALGELGVEPSAGSLMLIRRYERRRAQQVSAVFSDLDSG